MANNVIKIKRTAYNASGVPQADEVQYGEWAWSNDDSKMYFTAADTSDGSDRILYIRDLIPDALSGGSGSARGKASFNNTNFSVSSGYVTIATNGVLTTNINNGAVTTDKIDTDAVTADKIDDDITLAGNCGVSGNWTVGGNLTVEGTTTTVDSENVTVKDKNIVLASNLSGDPLTSNGTAYTGAGITIGTNASAPQLTWNTAEATEADYWLFSHKTKITGGLYETEIDGGDFSGS
jgi:hypothetical protein